MIRAMPKSVTITCAARQQDIVWFQVAVHDSGRVRVRQRVRDLRADLRGPLPRQPPVPAISAPSDRPGNELHDDPRRAVMLHHVVDRDHPGMVQPRRGTAPPASCGPPARRCSRRLPREQHLLDRDLPVEELVVTAPDPAHAALADRLGQQVPPGNQNPRPTWHNSTSTTASTATTPAITIGTTRPALTRISCPNSVKAPSRKNRAAS